MTQNNQETIDDRRNDKYVKFVFVIAVCVFLYFWLFGSVNRSEHFEAKLNCGLMEQFVEIYEMDVICNKSFKDNKINRFEYWSITWKYKKIEEIWDENLKNGKGRPARVVNSATPIPQRFFNVEDFMVIPGLDELVKKRDERNNDKGEDTGNE